MACGSVVVIGDGSKVTENIEHALKVRGIPFERASERFAEQYAGYHRPAVVVGARCFECLAGLRQAIELYERGW